jgi:hypothetical protein
MPERLLAGLVLALGLRHAAPPQPMPRDSEELQDAQDRLERQFDRVLRSTRRLVDQEARMAQGAGRRALS